MMPEEDAIRIEQFFDDINWGPAQEQPPTKQEPPPAVSAAQPVSPTSTPVVGAFIDVFLDPDEPPDQQTLLEFAEPQPPALPAGEEAAARSGATATSNERALSGRFAQVPWPYWVLLSSVVGIALGLLAANR